MCTNIHTLGHTCISTHTYNLLHICSHPHILTQPFTPASTTHKHTHIYPNPQHKHPTYDIYTHLHTYRHTIYSTHRHTQTHPPTSIFYPQTPIPTSFPLTNIFSHIHTYMHAYLPPTHIYTESSSIQTQSCTNIPTEMNINAHTDTQTYIICSLVQS